MGKYEVKILDSVSEKDLPKIDRKLGDNIIKITIAKLSTHPNVYGSPLRNEYQGYRKLKVSKYRVIYQVKGDVVTIHKIGIRSKVYGD